MAIKVVKKPVVVKTPVTASVEVEKNKAVVKQESVPVATVDAVPPTANVGFSAAYTKNLGDYESLKIAVSLFMPVPVNFEDKPHTDEAIDEAFVSVQGWVDKKINELLDELAE